MLKINLTPEEAALRLKKLQIFSIFSNSEINELISACNFYQYDDKEKIIRQDETSTFLCGIVSGEVDILTTAENGRSVKLGHVLAGDIVGETSLLADLKRTADVVACGQIEAVIILRDKLLSFIHNNPQAGLKIFAFIILSLIHKLKSINREMVLEKEATVTAQDLERLKSYFRPVVEDFISHS